MKSPAAAPLHGVTVLELHRYSPGQFCTMYLADFGATVIKVEEPAGLRFAEGSEAASRPTLNRGKQSIVVNLKTTEGKALFRQLVRRADVVVEGYRPGVMERLGLGYENLSRENERLIYCAISGFGQSGPYRERAGHDLNYMALGGLLALTGTKQRPIQVGLQLADLGAGAMPAVIGILLALLARQQTDRGQFIDLSIADGVVAWLAAQVDGLLAGGGKAGREETVLNGGAAYYGIYETGDGRFLTIAALEPWFWRRFCELIGRADLVDMHGPAADQTTLRAELETTFRSRTLAEWEALLGKEDVCYAPVLAPMETLAEPHFAEREMVRTDSACRPIGSSIKLSETPPDTDRPAPGRGEHTRSVLSALGYRAADIEELYQQGVCQ